MTERPPIRRQTGAIEPAAPEELMPTLLPTRRSQVMDPLQSAQAIIAASTGLAVALERMPGPLWAIINDRHNMEEHGLQWREDCVACQFDRLLQAAHAHDTLRRPQTPRFQDPADLFPTPGQAMVGAAGWDANATPPAFPRMELKGTRTGRLTVEADGTQVLEVGADATAAMPAQDDPERTQESPEAKPTPAGGIAVTEVEGRKN